MIRTDENGEELGRSYYHMAEVEGFSSGDNCFNSIVMGLENSAVAAGTVHLRDGHDDGLILKWENDHPGPFFRSWTPADTLLSCLPGDSIQFAVHAEHQWQDNFDIYWWVDQGDTISNDTTVTVQFEELGDYTVNCSINDEMISGEKRWHVSAVEFCIDSFSPDSTDLTIRRNSPIDLVLNVRMVDGLEIDYDWRQTGRIEDNDIPGEDSIRVAYNLAGEYIINAQVTGGEWIEENSWNIKAVSSLWRWWPHHLEMVGPNDSLNEFVLFPFNQESDSWTYLWLHNGDTLYFEVEENIRFEGIGDHLVQGFLWDGSDVDSVSWTITMLFFVLLISRHQY